MVRSSAHAHVTHRCGDCGHEVAKWVGRCPECQSWGSVAAAGTRSVTAVASVGAPSAPARPISQIDLH
ncbi:MAG: DNA repair protein RadA, partial [Pseudonocardiaceae bacterium]